MQRHCVLTTEQLDWPTMHSPGLCLALVVAKAPIEVLRERPPSGPNLRHACVCNSWRLSGAATVRRFIGMVSGGK
eukprot:4442065-Alexandrium_andersonii.AAC.1